jgi:hypothetical protein
MLGKLQAKVETHRERLRMNEELISGGVFKTDDPNKNEHVVSQPLLLCEETTC